MNETEFLDLLRYYFRNAKTEEVEEILGKTTGSQQ